VELVDLTIPIEHAMPTHPGNPTAGFMPFTTVERDGFEQWSLALFTQIGTHIDAPRHFMQGGRPVDQLELNRCVGPATVVRVEGKTGDIIGPDVFAEHRDSIDRTRRVLLHTGWDRYLGAEEYFEQFPSLTVEAAHYLVHRGVLFLGMDTPSPHVTDYRGLHEALFANEMVIAESLVGLGQLRADEVFLIALPLKLTGLDGSPARVVAMDGVPDGMR